MARMGPDPNPADNSTGQAAAPLYADAIGAVLGAVRPGPSERVDFEQAIGRTLRTPIVADRDLPPFDRAQMDGYAVRRAELRIDSPMPVVATVPAGSFLDRTVPPGACVAIATGAPLPADCDTVVPHEQSDRASPVRFVPPADRLAAGHAVHRRGADARRGDTLVHAGAILGARHIAIAATVGATSIDVAARPRVAILTSGDEVVSPSNTPRREQIRDSNGPLLAALVVAMGGDVPMRRHLADEASPTRASLDEALASHDVVATVGGISAGERDRFRAAAEAARVEFIVRRARLQPGGPIAIGVAPSGAIFLGVPGNPVSALVCAHLFLWPILRRRCGGDGALPWRIATLRESATPNPARQAFRPARLAADGGAIVPRWAGSGDLAHTAETDGILELPPQSEPIAVGASLRFLPWCDASGSVARRSS